MIAELAVAALSGSALTAILAPIINRRKNKLDEAKIVQDIYSRITDELEERDRKQEATISRLREVIISLTDILNECLPKIEGITTDEKRRLREAALEARLTGLAA